MKVVALAMAAAAVVCAVAAFWDQIMDLIDTVIDRVEEKRADRCFEPDEFADFDDGAL